MIAYYVHHHGHGHAMRAGAIAAELNIPVLGLSSRQAPAGWTHRWEVLPDDAAGVDCDIDDITAHGTFHWVPKMHAGLAARMAAIASILASERVDLLVSDVSVEVAVLARLVGTPVVIVAQPGERTDRPHKLAYDLADRLLAPWPTWAHRYWPAEWLAKTTHLGAVSRFSGRSVPLRPGGGRPRVLVLWGSGGLAVSTDAIAAAAAASGDWDWEVAGLGDGKGVSHLSNLCWLGWTENPWEALCRADVVVSHAGQNAVAEIAVAERPAILMVQSRPFAEQEATGRVLEEAGIAQVVRHWPVASEWPALLTAALEMDGVNWRPWTTGGGATEAARALEAIVTGSTQ